MLWRGVVLTLSLVTVSGREDQAGCDSSGPAMLMDGDVTITALLDMHADANCAAVVSEGIRQVAASVWTVRRLNAVDYVQGMNIGLAVYDACSSNYTSLRTATRVIVQQNLLGCSDGDQIGLVTTRRIAGRIAALTKVLDVPVLEIPEAPLADLLNATLLVLQELNWTSVSVVTSSGKMEAFRVAAPTYGICVSEAFHFSDVESSTFTRQTAIVVIGSHDEIESGLVHMKESDVNDGGMLLACTDAASETLITDLGEMIPTSVLLLGRKASVPNLEALPTSHPKEKLQPGDFKSLKNVPDFIHTAPEVVSSILYIAQHLKSTAPLNCSGNSLNPCRNITLPPSSSVRVLSADEMSLELGILATKSKNSFVMFYAKRQANSSVYLKEVATLSIDSSEPFEGSVLWKADHLQKSISSSCADCKCVREEVPISEPFTGVQWRHHSWIAACVSISALGVLCSVIIIVFVVVRMCKGDLLEGNPGFSFVLLVSIIFMYSSVLPFGLEGKAMCCTLRYLGTTMSYAVVFSVIVARSLLLAFCDNGGFMSHVNGYLQTALYIFIVGVQVALSTQFWVMNSGVLWNMEGSRIVCTIDNTLMIFSLLYDMFLLVVLLCVSPFVMRSKRNYREGGFFFVAAVLSFILWICWTTCYMLLPAEWQDASIVAGLTGTATVALVTIFIPRTYLMTSGMVRDELTSVLPPINNIPSVTVRDVKYRGSTNALYDSISHLQRTQGPTGVYNPNFYSEQPPACKYMSSDSTPENTYARYDSPPSPSKVTHL